MTTGTISKLKTKLVSPVEYHLPLGDELINMNELINKKITLEFSGEIYCIDTGKKIKKSYGQGFSFESYMTKASCDSCLFQPERCHYAKGTCREPEWGVEHCMIPHIVYLANTSGLKVGITRQPQVPTRWMDQGAVSAIPLFKVKDRLTSGKVEVEISKKLNDKTNWRAMLKKEIAPIDLKKERTKIYKEFETLIRKFDLEKIEDDQVDIDYPDMGYPEKLSTLTFDKKPVISGTLLGIKGQYLIFDCGVLNVRRHQGYKISLSNE